MEKVIDEKMTRGYRIKALLQAAIVGVVIWFTATVAPHIFMPINGVPVYVAISSALMGAFGMTLLLRAITGKYILDNVLKR